MSDCLDKDYCNGSFRLTSSLDAYHVDRRVLFYDVLTVHAQIYCSVANAKKGRRLVNFFMFHRL